MLPFYYVRTIEKLEIALLDMFNDLRVNKYTDITRTTYTKTVPVPITIHADKNFANHWRNRESKKIPLPIPCAGIRFDGINRNTPAVTQATYARSIYSRSTKQWIQDIQPTPYLAKYSMEILCDNRSDWGQLLENIIPYFNSYRTLRIKEFDFFPDIENKVNVNLDNITTIFEDELEAGPKHRFIKIQLAFSCQIDLYRPFEIPEIIKYAEMNISVGDFIHKHQVLVYPDALAEREKKEWELLAPSSREGLSLLKSVAGTLVKESTYDGQVIWKNITIPDAIRPTKVPNFKELALLFDDDAPEEMDNSGFGRDFIALNPTERTHYPDMPPDGGESAPDGWEVNPTTEWNNILTWFGSEKGLNGSPMTFDITLQFNGKTVNDTIFQSLSNKETKNYQKSGKTLSANEVFFEWGLISNKLYFNMRTVAFNESTTTFDEKLSATFTTEDELKLNTTDIYRFIFVLYEKGNSGVFGYSVNNKSTISINTVKE